MERKKSYHKPEKTALQRALDLLNYKARSVSEMRQRLFKEEFPEEETEQALNRLVELSLINDTAIAESTTRRYAKKGNRYIAQKMKQRGLDVELLPPALEQIDDELSRAIEAAHKKSDKIKDTDERKRYEKLYRHLAGAGFSSNIIQKAIKQVKEDAPIDHEYE